MGARKLVNKATNDKPRSRTTLHNVLPEVHWKYPRALGSSLEVHHFNLRSRFTDVCDTGDSQSNT